MTTLQRNAWYRRMKYNMNGEQNAPQPPIISQYLAKDASSGKLVVNESTGKYVLLEVRN